MVGISAAGVYEKWSLGSYRSGLEHVLTEPSACPIQNPKRAKPVPPAPPPEKTSGEKRKEILKKANRQHHARQ
jgi:hypothetical protein